DALDELRDARRRIDAGTLRQHRGRNEMVGEEPAHAVAQLVADRSPRARDLEVSDVMRHEARARTEDREVKTSLAHEPQLIALDRFAQLVVAHYRFPLYSPLVCRMSEQESQASSEPSAKTDTAPAVWA